MFILGIDPGYARLGFAVLEKNGSKYSSVEYGVVETVKELKIECRLKKIYDELENVITIFKPEVLGIEKLFFNTNQKTAIDVAQARGVSILAGMNKGLKIFEISPLEVKKSLTGYGKAEKSQVQYMVKTILGLDEIPKPDDVADALAIALCI